MVRVRGAISGDAGEVGEDERGHNIEERGAEVN